MNNSIKQKKRILKCLNIAIAYNKAAEIFESYEILALSNEAKCFRAEVNAEIKEAQRIAKKYGINEYQMSLQILAGLGLESLNKENRR